MRCLSRDKQLRICSVVVQLAASDAAPWQRVEDVMANPNSGCQDAVAATLTTLNLTELREVVRELWNAPPPFAYGPIAREGLRDVLSRRQPSKSRGSWTWPDLQRLPREELEALLGAWWASFFWDRLLCDDLDGEYGRMDEAVGRLSPKLAAVVRRSAWPGAPSDKLTAAVVHLVTSAGNERASPPYKPYTVEKLVELRRTVQHKLLEVVAKKGTAAAGRSKTILAIAQDLLEFAKGR
ncbi:hypothetical protein GPECTOR_10g897 [Gonium pectorale]|uniref:Uncharacterized protein n=1 Tax=Gonium pectorale TaxID=33097 RepID=A0A150GQW8_GONPE|nr:hypothetical protein GPECTOR_10g897 [Gonium pectorale]|eukprot:KXZ52266.1 hypothetical protein GPECTOR_10g897 [Gonium pectorale]